MVQSMSQWFCTVSLSYANGAVIHNCALQFKMAGGTLRKILSGSCSLHSGYRRLAMRRFEDIPARIQRTPCSNFQICFAFVIWWMEYRLKRECQIMTNYYLLCRCKRRSQVKANGKEEREGLFSRWRTRLTSSWKNTLIFLAWKFFFNCSVYLTVFSVQSHTCKADFHS